MDELLHYYHGKLTSILDQYGYSNVYPYTEMKKDFDECFLFGIICGNTHAQVIFFAFHKITGKYKNICFSILDCPG